MRHFLALLVTLLAAGEAATAEAVPLPKPRPASLAERSGREPPPAASGITALAPAPELQNVPPLPHPEARSGPSACDLRLADLAEFTPLPVLLGPGECGAEDVVQLNAVTLRDRTRVAFNPAPILRCVMAEALAHFMRDDVAPAVAEVGAPLAAVINYDSFECRGRNRVVGAKLSEHGKANAIDIRGFRLGNGSVIELTSPVVSRIFRERVRTAACSRFTTVLGPGSDGYHESHVHFDLAERKGGYRMCQWDVREPPVLADVPLPLPRPVAQAEDEKPK